MISVFDLFKIGIGPSSSHTVGPMRAARSSSTGSKADGAARRVARVRAELFGSLGATGHGHGSDKAVLLGLEGEAPGDGRRRRDRRAGRARSEPAGRLRAARRATRSPSTRRRPGVAPARAPAVPPQRHALHARSTRPRTRLRERTYYSVGGGFVVDEAARRRRPHQGRRHARCRYPFRTGAELLRARRATGLRDQRA